jgi:hypothetical protein
LGTDPNEQSQRIYTIKQSEDFGDALALLKREGWADRLSAPDENGNSILTLFACDRDFLKHVLDIFPEQIKTYPQILSKALLIACREEHGTVNLLVQFALKHQITCSLDIRSFSELLCNTTCPIFRPLGKLGNLLQIEGGEIVTHMLEIDPDTERLRLDSIYAGDDLEWVLSHATKEQTTGQVNRPGSTRESLLTRWVEFVDAYTVKIIIDADPQSLEQHSWLLKKTLHLTERQKESGKKEVLEAFIKDHKVTFES